VGIVGGSRAEDFADDLGLAYEPGLSGYVSLVSLSEEEVSPEDLKAYVQDGGSLLVSIRSQKEADLLPMGVKVSRRPYACQEIPADPAFQGLSMSDLYYRKVLTVPQVMEVAGKPAKSGVLGVVPFGKGRIVYAQIRPRLFRDPWQKTKVIRIYNTILTNLGGASAVGVDLCMIGGYGLAREWLPGYANTITDLEKRPVVKDSPLYAEPALDFDPDRHRIW
jgi:hypothetical protein